MNDITTEARGNSAASRDIAFAIHPYTNLKTHLQNGPLVITRGEGVHVYDEEGKQYIEGMAGLWCTALGYNENRLVEAATKAMRRLPYYHQFGGKAHDTGIDLAERLIGMAPVPMSKVFFANSGSEANDTAMKLVWYFWNAMGKPEKKKIVSRIKAYHGVTIASASLTGLPNNHREFDLPIARVLHTDCPQYYRFAEAGESEVDFASRLAANLEALILREGPETIGAFFAEPVMGAGGVILPPDTYFEKVQAILKKYDILFVVDEVICGFGRTGNMFGCQTYNLVPDMISVAKNLSSAYLPISALLINERVFQGMVMQSEKIGTFGHGYTYSGHPVAAAVALETLKIYAERDIVGQVRRVAPGLQAGLRKLGEHPVVGEARGIGLIGGLELVKNKKTKESFDPKQMVGQYLAKRTEAHGLILRAIGDTIAVCPPLIIAESDIDHIIDRLGRALDDTAAWLSHNS